MKSNEQIGTVGEQVRLPTDEFPPIERQRFAALVTQRNRAISAEKEIERLRVLIRWHKSVTIGVREADSLLWSSALPKEVTDAEQDDP